MIENGSNSSAAETMPSSQGCRARFAMAESLPSYFHLVWMNSCILRAGESDTINAYVGCDLFHAPV